ncbi:hypothetical protein QTO03_21575, partial [Vibrio campbellii]
TCCSEFCSEEQPANVAITEAAIRLCFNILLSPKSQWFKTTFIKNGEHLNARRLTVAFNIQAVISKRKINGTKK